MFIGAVCSRQVATCVAEMTAFDVARIMRLDQVGDLVVVEYRNGEPVPVGIVSDRDLVVNVMAMGMNPNQVTVGDVMSRELIIAHEGEVLDVALQRMRGAGVRRIPLVDSAGILVGIVSLDDIVKTLGFTLTNVSRVGKAEHRG
jgi:CBS domain-containing protein